METKLDSRQGQFPATFPDTFKDFFAVMNEDENVELFSNLLEDKVIPRTSRYNQRRCGGSLRCTNSNTINVGRSNSFRVNRPSSSSMATATGNGGGGGSSSSSGLTAGYNYCKHVKYCCLHQKHYSQNFLDYRHCQNSGSGGGGVGGSTGNIGIVTSSLDTDGYDEDNDDDDDGLRKTKTKRQLNLERKFDFENCDDSDTISTSSSTTTTIPYNPLHRISHQHNKKFGFHSKESLPASRQQQQQQQQHQQQQQQQCGLRAPVSGNIIVGLEGSCNSSTNVCGNGAGYGGGGSSNTGALNSSSTSITASVTAPTITGTSTSSVSSSSSSGGGVGSTTVTSTAQALINSAHCVGGSNNSNRNNSISSGGGVGNRSIVSLYCDNNNMNSTSSMTQCYNTDKLNCCSRPNTIMPSKSPILNRRRSSSIAANLLTADNKIFRNTDDLSSWAHNIPHSTTRERLALAKSPVKNVSMHLNRKSSIDGGGITSSSGVLTFKQAMSGAVSPQNLSSSSLIGGSGEIENTNNLMSSCYGDTTASAALSTTPTSTNPMKRILSPTTSSTRIESFLSGCNITSSSTNFNAMQQQQGFGTTQRQRMRTSSMPVESRKPRLADTRRAAIHCADLDLEYYRLRSFSITSHGICNLGDSLRSRRSRSINSVTSTGTSNSEKGRNNSNGSRISADLVMDTDAICGAAGGENPSIPAYKIAMLGSASVGKTALTYQFTTSDYICAYDLSLDDDYGQKTVSVLVDGIETDLEIIDHPACEMSTEAFCSTYNVDLFVVVYSVVDKSSFKAAEKVLNYLKECEMLLTRGAILVGNKTDLERHREVTRQMGRKLAKEIACKFIETSSGLDHNVNELLVGVVAQVKLNPQRIRRLTEQERQRLCLNTTIQKHRRMDLPKRKIVKQASIYHHSDNDDHTITSTSGITTSTLLESEKSYGGNNNNNNSKINQILLNKSGQIRKTNKRVLNLENILKVGESEIEDDDDGYRPNLRKRDLVKQHRTKLPTLQATGSSDTTSSTSCDSTKNMINKNSSSSNDAATAGSSLSPTKLRNSYENYKKSATTSSSNNLSNDSINNILDETSTLAKSYQQCGVNDNINSCRKSVSKLSNRTKIFLSSVLKFKKNLNVKRRSSSSCSDLFVI